MKVSTEHYNIIKTATNKLIKDNELIISGLNKYSIYQLWSTFTIRHNNSLPLDSGQDRLSFYFDKDNDGYYDQHIVTACKKVLNELTK